MSTTDEVLAFDGVVAGYGDTMVLRGIAGTLAKGQVLGVLGRNGVGKTTLMRALTGTIALKSGAVRMHGADMAGIDLPRRLAAGMAYAPQENTVFGDLSVEENLRVHLRERGMARYAECLAAFPRLRERMAQRAGALSGGERKLLSFTRTLGLRAGLSLVDEPTEGVQPENILKMGRLLRERCAQGAAFVVVEQNLTFLQQIADHVLVLDHGECVARGAMAAFTREALERHLTV